jgi:hypothetical protein
MGKPQPIWLSFPDYTHEKWDTGSEMVLSFSICLAGILFWLGNFLFFIPFMGRRYLSPVPAFGSPSNRKPSSSSLTYKYFSPLFSPPLITSSLLHRSGDHHPLHSTRRERRVPGQAPAGCGCRAHPCRPTIANLLQSLTLSRCVICRSLRPFLESSSVSSLEL